MQDSIQRVIAALRAGDSPEIRERLLESALLFEKSRGVRSYRGISQAVDATEISPEGIAELRAALIQFSQRYPEHPDVGTSFWALGKLRDESLRQFFIAEMRRHFQTRRHHPVSQADCALQGIGSGVNYVYPPGESGHDGYYEAVRLYLDQHAA